jgi:hypothetical protein
MKLRHDANSGRGARAFESCRNNLSKLAGQQTIEPSQCCEAYDMGFQLRFTLSAIEPLRSPADGTPLANDAAARPHPLHRFGNAAAAVTAVIAAVRITEGHRRTPRLPGSMVIWDDRSVVVPALPAAEAETGNASKAKALAANTIERIGSSL